MSIDHKHLSTSWGRWPTRRIAGTAITAILATALASGAVAPAYASLAGPRGATDAVNGFPLSYSDGSVVLGQCVEGPQCVADVERPNPAAPAVFPGNFPSELFWFAAFSGTTAQPALYEAALEGAFTSVDGSVEDGQQQAFARLRFRLDDLVAGASYTIRHPYGTHTFLADPFGVIDATNDQGCEVQPCDFALAGAAFVGNSAGTTDGFLTQTNRAPGFIGDLDIPGKVTGAPSGLNAVIVTGPNAGGPGIPTLTVEEFVVQGELVGPATVARAPLTPTVTAGTSSAVVRWSAPGNGGSNITGYWVRAIHPTTGAQIGKWRFTTPATHTSSNSLNFTGLAGGTAVRFHVAASSAVGLGAISARSGIVVPRSIPGKPVIGVPSSGSVGGVVNAAARWTPPANTGGLAINGYVVTALRMSAGGAVVKRTTSSVKPATTRVLAMVLPSGFYRFEVRARNSLGLGVASTRSTQVIAR